MKLQISMMTAAALLIAPSALAQTAQTAPASPAPAAAPTASATASTVTDAEISQFATAAVAAGKINADASVAAADKNAKIVAAITATGLTAERFNEIGQAMQADPALNKRVQDAAAKLQPAPATTTTP